jgi:hypothetical protein
VFLANIAWCLLLAHLSPLVTRDYYSFSKQKGKGMKQRQCSTSTIRVCLLGHVSWDMDLYERKHQEYYVTPPSVVIQIRELFVGGGGFLLLPHVPNKFILFHLKNLLPIQQTKASRFGAINKKLNF